MRYLLMIAMFLLQTGFAIAGEDVHGDWATFVGSNGDGLAITTSGTGLSNVLGIRCYKSNQSCTQFLVTDMPCEKNAKVPMLANFADGTLFVMGQCTYNDDTHRYELYLNDFTELHSSLENNKEVGFAIPMKSGAFKAIRFSLRGSKAAMDEAANIATHKQAIPGGNTTQRGSGYF